MKMELLQPIPQRYNYQGILWKIICQQTGQPGRNGQILKHPHSSKTQSGGNRSRTAKTPQTQQKKRNNKDQSRNKQYRI